MNFLRSPQERRRELYELLTPEQQAAGNALRHSIEMDNAGIGQGQGALGPTNIDSAYALPGAPLGDATVATMDAAERFSRGVGDSVIENTDWLGMHPELRGLLATGAYIGSDPFNALDLAAPAMKALPILAGLGMIAGKGAKTADIVQLHRAQKMAKAKIPRENILKDTGWFQGVDGQWRFEIDDSAMGLSDKAWEGGYGEGNRLMRGSEALDHPELNQAYDLDNTGFMWRDGMGNAEGNYGDGIVSIDTGTSNPVSVASHEFQHNIQDVENFARGGSPGDFARGPMFDNRAKELTAQLSESLTGGVSGQADEVLGNLKYGDPAEMNAIAQRNGFNDIDEAAEFIRQQDLKRTPFGQYQRLAGEVEARAVQNRLNLTPDERAARPFWLDYDVPEADQIVRMDQNALAEMTAYHGTPHRFPPTKDNPLGEFDLNKIGSGEGAQAYGHGIYLAETPGVAGDYQRTLAYHKFGDGSFITPDGATVSATDAAHEIGYSLSFDFPNDGLSQQVGADYATKAMKSLDDGLDKAAALTAAGDDSARRAAVDLVYDKYKYIPAEKGSLLEVDLPDSQIDKMLDWDAPLKLGEIPAGKKMELLSDVGLSDKSIRYDTLKGKDLHEMLVAEVMTKKDSRVLKALFEHNPNHSLRGVQEIHPSMIDGREANAVVSEYLALKGIPGIKYLDGTSRSAGEGTRNFVIFSPEIAKIVGRK